MTSDRRTQWAGYLTGGADRSQFHSMFDQQASDKQLQPLALALLPLKKLDAHGSSVSAAHHRRTDGHRVDVGGNLQPHFKDSSDREIRMGDEATATHRYIDECPLARNGLPAERHRESDFHAIVLAPVFFNPNIPNAPLEKPEPIAAKLAFEWINVEGAEKLFQEP